MESLSPAGAEPAIDRTGVSDSGLCGICGPGELGIFDRARIRRIRELVALLGGFGGESESDGLGDGNQREQTRIAMRRQRALKTLTLDAGGLCDAGHPLRLGEVAQGN